ncbi:hypothetical protein COCON_G00160020 [Conger conger]|uniref:Uncharacterized protein n=1 Tax=Conger conger TaxID=82655 RepID=A0A9Q1HV83_CONCO|nr:hypothetical protein COCON_G00160020 [Conger conger]
MRAFGSGGVFSSRTSRLDGRSYEAGLNGGAPLPTPAMGIQGMELFAIGVVIILFVAVLKQFGILEPMSLEGGRSPLDAETNARKRRRKGEENDEAVSVRKFEPAGFTRPS